MLKFLLTLSQNGSIHLKREQLVLIDFHHIHSGLVEPETFKLLSHYDQPSTINGYTEWITKTEPCITLGWDWELRISEQNVNFTIVGYPYSNIQLINHSNQSLPPLENQNLLRKFIQHLNWEVTCIQKLISVT